MAKRKITKSKLWEEPRIKRGTPYTLTLIKGALYWKYWDGEQGNSEFHGPTETPLIGVYSTIQDARKVAYYVVQSPKYRNKDVMVQIDYAGYDTTKGIVDCNLGITTWTTIVNGHARKYPLNKDGSLGKKWDW